MNHIEHMFHCAPQGNATLDSVLQQYDELFQPELGCFTGETVVLNESKAAKFHNASAVPLLCNRKWKALAENGKRRCD